MSLVERASSNRTVRLVFLEAFLIVFGVIAAWGATRWSDEQDRQQRSEVALGAILQELSENRTAIRSSATYHGQVIRQLFALQEGQVPTRAVFVQGFVRPAEVTTAAWDLGRETGALEALPYDQFLELARVYSDQARYQDQGRDLGQLIYDRISREGSQGILRDHRNHLEILMTMVYRECTVDLRYGEVLSHFSAEEVAMDPPEGCDLMPTG